MFGKHGKTLFHYLYGIHGKGKLMKPQFEILTRMKLGMRENGSLVINPFFGRTEEDIHKNNEYAKDIYACVFRTFISNWYLLYSNSELSSVPPCHWEDLFGPEDFDSLR